MAQGYAEDREEYVLVRRCVDSRLRGRDGRAPSALSNSLPAPRDGGAAGAYARPTARGERRVLEASIRRCRVGPRHRCGGGAPPEGRGNLTGGSKRAIEAG